MDLESNIYQNALPAITDAIHIMADTVRPTIGKGRNVLIEVSRHPFYISTKDSYSIIKNIKFTNPIYKQASRMAKDATDSQNKRSKDGRTAMMLITDAILQEVKKEEPSNHLMLAEQMTALVPMIEKEILSKKKSITISEVKNVASTAADSKVIGEYIQEIYNNVGKDGMIDIESSGTWETHISYIEGVRLPGCGFSSPALVHDPEAKKANRTETTAVYEKPSILITKRKIENLSVINPLLWSLTHLPQDSKLSSDLIIFYNDMNDNVLSELIAVHGKAMNLCLIKAPALFKDSIYEDFAKMTGAKIVSDETGIFWKDLPLAVLGTCGKIIVDQEEMRITGIKDISEHIAYLKTKTDEESKVRLHWLTMKTGILRLGAISEGELSSLRLKTQDAIHSSYLALQDGIVTGAGVSLYDASKILLALNTRAGDILAKALQAPAHQIIINGGRNPENIKGFGGENGFNAKTGRVGNLHVAGIVDSAIVVFNSVKNAVGLASLCLHTSGFVAIPAPTQLELLAMSQQNNQMQF